MRPGTSSSRRVPTITIAAITKTAIVISSAELVNETSILPICSGTIGLITNCSSGCSSSATSVLVLVVPRRAGVAAAHPDLPPHPDDRSVHVPHARADAEKKHHHHRRRLGPKPGVDRPPDGDRHHHRNDQLDTNAQPECQRVLVRRRASRRELRRKPATRLGQAFA